MSPKVPEAYLEARRMEIINAAYKCFTEKGFHNTTMQDIYNATKLSPGAVYNYFSSKEEIVISAVKEYTDWSISSVAPILSEKLPDTLAKCVKFWISSVKNNENSKNFSVTLEHYAEATRNSSIRETLLKSQDATHEKLVDIIKYYQQKGIINAKLDPLSIAQLIGGVIFGIAIHRMLNPEVDMDAYSQVCEAIFNGTFTTQSSSKN
jgi:AcrR family transcriptional regulator